MRISDWSSDVCSADLQAGDEVAEDRLQPEPQAHAHGAGEQCELAQRDAGEIQRQQDAEQQQDVVDHARQRIQRCLVHALAPAEAVRTEEHTSELQSLMRISYAVICLKKTNERNTNNK